MRAVSIQCPNCGARLTVQATLAQVSCEYCGTVSRVQHRTRVFELTKPLPPPPVAQQHLPVAVQMHSKTWYLAFIVPIIVVVFGGGMAYFIQKKVRDRIDQAHSRANVQVGQITDQINSLRGTKSSKTGDWFGWSGMGPALMFDVNGDGSPDPIGRLRYTGDRDAITIAAFDAGTGKQLWESDALGTYSETYQGPLAVHGRTLLFADSAGKVSAYSAADGSQLWQISLGERTRTFCGLSDRDGAALIVTADRKRQVIALATGAIESAPKRAKCMALPSDAHDRDHTGPGVERVKSLRWSSKQRKAAGMKPSFGLRHRDSEVTAVFGDRHPGTRVPMVGGQRGGELVWKVNLAAGNPLEVDAKRPELTTITADGVIALYQSGRDKAYYVTKLALSDGARQWHVRVPDGLGGSVYRGLVATDRYAFISSWGRLDAFELATGKHVYRIGR